MIVMNPSLLENLRLPWKERIHWKSKKNFYDFNLYRINRIKLQPRKGNVLRECHCGYSFS